MSSENSFPAARRSHGSPVVTRSCAAYIGRVGALAVTLGVGAAIAFNPAVGSADTAGSAASGSEASSPRSSVSSASSTPDESGSPDSPASVDASGSDEGGTIKSTGIAGADMSDGADKAGLDEGAGATPELAGSGSSEVPGSDTEGTEVPGSDTEGTEVPGSDTEGTEVPGSDTEGTEVPGSDTEGTEVPGSDTEGTEVPGSDTVSTGGGATAGQKPGLSDRDLVALESELSGADSSLIDESAPAVIPVPIEGASQLDGAGANSAVSDHSDSGEVTSALVPIGESPEPTSPGSATIVTKLVSGLLNWLGWTPKASSDNSDTPVSSPLSWLTLAFARREIGQTADTTVNRSDSPAIAASPALDSPSVDPGAASLVGLAGSATDATADTTVGPAASSTIVITPTAAANAGTGSFIGGLISIFFGNGTAERPNGGLLIGNGFSYDASTCTGGSVCNGGNAGLLGNGGHGFNGGDGGSAGWFGDGGNGSEGIDGAPDGKGGAGGLFYGTSGRDGGPVMNAGTGAARDAAYSASAIVAESPPTTVLLIAGMFGWPSALEPMLNGELTTVGSLPPDFVGEGWGEIETVVGVQYKNWSFWGQYDGRDQLDLALQAVPADHQIIVVGASMGAYATWLWQRDKAPTSNIDPDRLLFVTMGQAMNMKTSKHVVNSRYRSIDVTRQWDRYADAPNMWWKWSAFWTAIKNAKLGDSTSGQNLHYKGYFDLSLSAPDRANTIGNATYLFYETAQIPLDGVTRELIESAYDRKYLQPQ